jgi:hypothetical protein
VVGNNWMGQLELNPPPVASNRLLLFADEEDANDVDVVVVMDLGLVVTVDANSKETGVFFCCCCGSPSSPWSLSWEASGIFKLYLLI